jgi:plasmid stabilization system protein ParE
MVVGAVSRRDRGIRNGSPQPVDLLKSFPLLGANVKGYRGVRRLLHSPFHIYYRVLPEQKRLEVLHFWHESRQPPRF